MRAFLTGSQIYGTPTEKSDIDLVVLMDDDDRNQLADMVREDEQKRHHNDRDAYGYAGSLNLKFGRLNLIVAKDEREWLAWRAGTTTLLSQAPVTREKAVSVFKDLRGRLCK